jgi:hexosaminidase
MAGQRAPCEQATSPAPALLPQPALARSLPGPPWAPHRDGLTIVISDEAARGVAGLLAEGLEAGWFAAPVSVVTPPAPQPSHQPASGGSPPPPSSTITLALDPAGVPALDALSGVPDEGYTLDVTAAGGVAAAARSPAGLFYATQTLLQLLPPPPPPPPASSAAAPPAPSPTPPPISIPPISIVDAPRFAWRGWLLDTARHFFGVPWLCKAIGAGAALKLNVFHWHLTDDQGWRLAVEGYPRLTEVGAWRAGTGGGGQEGGGGGPGGGAGGAPRRPPPPPGGGG